MNINTINLLNNYQFDIIKLDLSSKQINGILNLDKFCNLTILYCNQNQITKLDNLPNSLRELYCYGNKITNLDNLPNSLTKLNCAWNQITNLDNLPNSLIMLNYEKVVKK